MTNVREAADGSPQRPAPTRGPRCHCGTPITHTPGKRPRIYCSDRCRKAAKRAISRATTPPACLDGAPASKSGQLGKETTEFPTPLRPAETSSGATPDTDPDAERSRRGKQRRSRRYADRRTLWNISGDRTCRGCGRTVMDPDSGVVLARTAEGNAVALGLLKCGKVWLCPVCSAKIRHGRAEEITKAAVSWMQAGGRCYLVTFTVRHAAAHRLADLFDALQGTRTDKERGITRKAGAYQRLITGGTWAGRPDRGIDGIRDRIGYVGMIRATEVTRSLANGWHPHIHALVFVGAETAGERTERTVTRYFTPSTSALDEWQAHFRSVWTIHLRAIDREFTPSDRHGVDFKQLETARDAQDLGQYIAKLQEGSDKVSPANEIARGDLKQGRHGSVTPFQLLGRIGDLMGGVPPEDAEGFGELDQVRAWWAEYEAATKGRRAIEWTRYLRAIVGLDGDDSAEGDMDLLFTDDSASAFSSGVHIETGAWHKVAGKALDLTAVETVEADRLADVAEVVAMSGGKSGAVRLLTPGEIDEAWSSTLTKLAERRENAAARRRIEDA